MCIKTTILLKWRNRNGKQGTEQHITVSRALYCKSLPKISFMPLVHFPDINKILMLNRNTSSGE